MASSTTKAFWAFIFYVKNNPFKSIDNMTENDFDEMVRQFAAVNETDGITVATAPDLPDFYGYGTVNIGTEINFPKKGTTTRWADDAGGIPGSTTYLLNLVQLKSASYPEEHLGE
jgi:hypothetical protein